MLQIAHHCLLYEQLSKMVNRFCAPPSTFSHLKRCTRKSSAKTLKCGFPSPSYGSKQSKHLMTSPLRLVETTSVINISPIQLKLYLIFFKKKDYLGNQSKCNTSFSQGNFTSMQGDQHLNCRIVRYSSIQASNSLMITSFSNGYPKDRSCYHNRVP